MTSTVVTKLCGCSSFTNATCRPLSIVYIVPTTARNKSSQATREKKERIIIKAEPPKDVKADWIGPPDRASNIRPIKFFIPADETSLEKKYREQRQEVWEWNQEFWEKHNKTFFKKKEEYVKVILAKKQESQSKEHLTTLTTEELSDFYKKILDDNYKAHIRYNIEWYKKNISMLWPAFLITTAKLWRRRKPARKS